MQGVKYISVEKFDLNIQYNNTYIEAETFRTIPCYTVCPGIGEDR